MTDFIVKKPALCSSVPTPDWARSASKSQKRIKTNAVVDPSVPVRSGVATAMSIKVTLALPVSWARMILRPSRPSVVTFLQARLLGLNSVPSSPTFTQRLMLMRLLVQFWPLQLEPRIALEQPINGKPIDLAPLACGYTPVRSRYLCYGNQWDQKRAVGRYLRWRGRLLPFCGCTGQFGVILPGVSFAHGLCSISASEE